MTFLSSRLSVAVVAAVLGASVVALSSGALTKNSPVRATTFYACEANSGGVVSTISVSSSLQCKKGFTKVAWNATGPTGARGPAGAQGTAGPAGAQGAIGPTGQRGQTHKVAQRTTQVLILRAAPSGQVRSTRSTSREQILPERPLVAREQSKPMVATFLPFVLVLERLCLQRTLPGLIFSLLKSAMFMSKEISRV